MTLLLFLHANSSSLSHPGAQSGAFGRASGGGEGAAPQRGAHVARGHRKLESVQLEAPLAAPRGLLHGQFSTYAGLLYLSSVGNRC